MTKSGASKKGEVCAFKTTEEKKKFLESYRAGMKELERLRAEYLMAQELESILKRGITKDAKKATETLREEEKRLCGALHQTLKNKRRIEEKIASVKDGTRALILRYRYIDGMRWEDISEELNYSWRNIHYMHKKALEDIAI